MLECLSNACESWVSPTSDVSELAGMPSNHLYPSFVMADPARHPAHPGWHP